MNLGFLAIQLVIAQVKAEELKDEKWLAEIKEARKNLVDYVRWRRHSESMSSDSLQSTEVEE